MWTLWCAIWVFLLSVSLQNGLGLNPSNNCTTPLGLEDLRIEDSQLTAQSHYESLSIGGGKSVDTEPKCARLNKKNCAWCAPRGKRQYLQVELRRNFIITGIAAQGFEALSDYYVKKYKVSHSRNGHTWSIFPEVMTGNHDGKSVVSHTFIRPVYARYIRVYPMAYRYRICMRMELYGCSNSSSALSTTPAPPTQSAANNATPENVPPTTRTTAASSTEKPIDQLVESSKVLITTPRAKETLPSERHSLQTGKIARIARGDSKKPSSEKLIIVLVVVGVAVVIIVICLLVWLIHRRKRKCAYLHPGDEIDMQFL
ncbi:discoidin, CUB and LCCL domain-containing protein 2-like isoform X2 [Acropora palmata]|uniref:discoidin, CUB and LCCL domain-containing protein 2-like isoform X2 n=1 Tax=Acropora palmata TaxID=6131 RepID=UPI003DA1BF5B